MRFFRNSWIFMRIGVSIQLVFREDVLNQCDWSVYGYFSYLVEILESLFEYGLILYSL